MLSLSVVVWLKHLLVMLVRIVRMYFLPDQVDDFLEMFERTKAAIRNAEGCSHLELFRDIHSPECFVTISNWGRHEDLEAYRQSELFKSTWRRVKPMFSKPAEAFTLESESIG
jgi:heme oxygenase (mycobilin-producing)